jgi:hypothetical protein
MPDDGMAYAKITDLFTSDEIDRAERLLLECKEYDEFYNRCTIGPVISRINEGTGHRSSVEYWAYRLAIYLGVTGRKG